jgi:hypothetical protein
MRWLKLIKGCKCRIEEEEEEEQQQHIFVNNSATGFGYKRTAVIRPELQDTECGFVAVVIKF